MAFWNTERKWFAGIVGVGIIVYIGSRKFGTPAATSSFTGKDFYSADGADNGGCHCCDECEKKENLLALVRQHLANAHNMRPSDVAALKERESMLVKLIAAKDCN